MRASETMLGQGSSRVSESFADFYLRIGIGLFNLSLCLRESCPQLSPWCQTIQFFPVCLWRLSIPGAGANREWGRGSLWPGPLRGFQQCPSSTASICTGFYIQKLWGLMLLALEPWAGKPEVGPGPLTPEISLPIFIYHTWVWDQPIPHPCPSYQSGYGFIFNSRVVRLPFSSIADGSMLVVL